MFCQMQSSDFGKRKESLELLRKLQSKLRCSDLELFLSSVVKKKKKEKKRKTKATISGILLKSIADMKRWSTYQLTDHSVSQYCTLK